ncbi:MAG: prephenate dehydrogenase [Actinomycetota bacterium]|nr:prephenate dehydrogenase [Actinomycetota bacterium]
MISKVHIVGLGMMGTNFALKLVNRGVQVSGEDLFYENLERAKKLGAINLDHNIETFYDVVVLAMPIGEIFKFLDKEINYKTKLIIDIGGTKELICEKMNSQSIPSVGGHPLCGVADNKTWVPTPEMFVNSTFLLCETKSSNEVSKQLAIELVKIIESNEIWIEPKKHDELIALTSHFPHVLSSALVGIAMKQQKLTDIIELASGGFDGATRLSRTSPNMISDMYLTNLNNVQALIKNLILELEKILEIDDSKLMIEYLAQTVDWRRALSEKFGERNLS